MNATLRALSAVLGFAIGTSAGAQDGPVRILVGFAPGGTSDVIARLIVDRLKSSLGTPVVVENRPGATGFIAAEALKNAAPDGKTLMLSPISVSVFAPLTYTRLRYDPIKDFAPVSLATNFQWALAVGPGSPAKTLHEYLAWVRANPAKATYGVPGVGGQPHFLGVMLARGTSAELAFVPYKGSSPLVADLVGGQVPAGIASVSDLVKHHQSGKVLMLASAGSQRSPAAPDVPTFRELGFAAVEGIGWQAFHAPARTPRPVIDRLSTAIASAIKAPEVNERLLALGLEPVGSTPDELAARIAEDTARWTPIVKASGFRADE
ncbi:MAG TPA: Bug family tripartite tricarboxylate transporter substrate binding protein [Burkholderiales bacterium]|nr:Bug family tripartite tricarboxylate transporter substrate binding protein [Burkholderiales bacterium]